MNHDEIQGQSEDIFLLAKYGAVIGLILSVIGVAIGLVVLYGALTYFNVLAAGIPL